MDKEKATCLARKRKRHIKPCGVVADTIRRIEAAPSIWIHVPLCHEHQHVWDIAGEWGGAVIYREDMEGWEASGEWRTR